MVHRLHVDVDDRAAAPVDPRVVDKMVPCPREQFANPASRSHAYGWDAARAVDEAREHVAAHVHPDPRGSNRTPGARQSHILPIKGPPHFPQAKGRHIFPGSTEPTAGR
ncbi:aminotransferase class V-fold PLP-dependent enzyme, partial [Burkholderia thailandensis]|uniref:aminotransferase class V-fold PLP-dependent enzyme n=1 Tax=Burkholderia thailandensis TaxID=57975 RepID=UPI00217CEACF